MININENSSMVQQKLIDYANELKFGELHFKFDQTTGLFAIIAIHSTKLGPALGGCRCLEYPSVDAAIQDAMRLAMGMSYKAAVTNLNLGGGKSVLLKPKHLADEDRDAYFQSFGKFINELNGLYITALDSGSKPTDMDSIAKQTRFVTSQASLNGNPSPFTAKGVFLAMQAALELTRNTQDFTGLKVAIQGAGNVGYILAKMLHQAGAKLFISDVDSDAVKKCVKEFQAVAVNPTAIYQVECDIFSPCALGAILNDKTIPQLNTSMIIGSANNQLAQSHHGEMLHKRKILYAPDYLVNSGGLIHAASQFYQTPLDEVKKQIEGIYTATLKVLDRAQKTNRPPYLVANEIAEERLYGNIA